MPVRNNIKMFEFELSTYVANENGEMIAKTGMDEYTAYYDESRTNTDEICALLEKNGVDSVKDFEHAVVLERKTADKLAALATRHDIATGMKADLRNDMDAALSLLEKSTSIWTPIPTNVQRGLYCLMNAYGLAFRIYDRDGSTCLELYVNDERPDALDANEIKKLDFDEAKFDMACNRVVFVNMLNNRVILVNVPDGDTEARADDRKNG